MDTTITAQDINVAFRDVFVPPLTRSLSDSNFKHERDGKFSDDELADILQWATMKTAGAFRARGTSPMLELVEVMAINQAREWGVCTMNKFRQSLGLKQFASFEEWNSTPDVAEAARKLYGHINNLELYVGLQAEDCMPLGPGSGLCCGYTMMRAVLASTISLARGDRYYTADYTREFLFIVSTKCFEDLNFVHSFFCFIAAANLTSWGYVDCTRDPDNGAFGAALPKLLMCHLPRHYPSKNVYSLFPFFTPESSSRILNNFGIVSRYDTSKPIVVPEKRVTVVSEAKVIKTTQGIDFVLSAKNERFKRFTQSYTTATQALADEDGFFMPSFDDKRDWDFAIGALFPKKAESIEECKNWYVGMVKQLLERNGTGIKKKTVDIAQVVNLASAHWSADLLVSALFFFFPEN